MKDRRTVVATVGAVALTLVAGSAALAANLGILGSTSQGPVGDFSPVVDVSETSVAPTTKPTVDTIYLDEYVTDDAQGDGSTTGPDGSEDTPTTVAPGSPAPLAGQPAATPDTSPEIGDPDADADIDDPTDPDHAEDPDHVEDPEKPEPLEGADDDD